MAKYKKMKYGLTRTPEEHRKILQEIDELQIARSFNGVVESRSRIRNTFGISKNMYKNSRKPEKQDKIYDLERYFLNDKNL